MSSIRPGATLGRRIAPAVVTQDAGAAEDGA
jgi:hypothetical protein